jgi:hypothetical protein
MTSQTLREYQLIREEMKLVKECMTTYVGFVLGGTGLAVYGLTSLGSKDVGYLGMAYTAFMMSLLVALVLLILFYKFHSHNRFAGYCKLLSQETFNYSGLSPAPDIFGWEICLEWLRRSEARPGMLSEFARETVLTDPTQDGLLRVLARYAVDQAGSWRKKQRLSWLGLERLASTIFDRTTTTSWGFPSFVAGVFFVLCSGFLVFAGYCTVSAFTCHCTPLKDRIVLIAVGLSVLVVQAFLWRSFCIRLHRLMASSTTVEGFFWRFLPIRARYLVLQGIAPRYAGANQRIAELE